MWPPRRLQTPEARGGFGLTGALRPEPEIMRTDQRRALYTHSMATDVHEMNSGKRTGEAAACSFRVEKTRPDGRRRASVKLLIPFTERCARTHACMHALQAGQSPGDSLEAE